MSTFIDVSGLQTVDPGKLPGSVPVTGTLNDYGVITVTGQPYSTLVFKSETAAAIPGKVGEAVVSLISKLSWVDVLAISLVVKTKTTNQYTGRPVMYAGLRATDEAGVILIAKEIADSSGIKSWNSIMIERQKLYPVTDHSGELTEPNSPYNPDSSYYDPNRSIWGYDPGRKIIIYSNGEIVWTETGNRYYDQANGIPYSYAEPDGKMKRIKFSSGNILDLDTLELEKPDGTKTKVKNELNFFQKLYRKLLTDTKTQLTVLAALFFLIILKKKRNEK